MAKDETKVNILKRILISEWLYFILTLGLCVFVGTEGGEFWDEYALGQVSYFVFWTLLFWFAAICSCEKKLKFMIRIEKIILTAADYCKLAEIEVKKNKYDSHWVAVDRFTQAIGKNPGLARAYVGRANVYMNIFKDSPPLKETPGERGKSQAIKDLTTAINLDFENYRFCLLERGLLYLERSKTYSYSDDTKTSYSEKAISDFTSYLDQDLSLEERRKCLLLLAETKHKLKDHHGAIQDYTTMIEDNNKDAEAYSGRGLAKHELKKYLEAIQDFNRAINLKPKDAINYMWRAASKERSEDYKGAMEDYNKAKELNPYYADADLSRRLS